VSMQVNVVLGFDLQEGSATVMAVTAAPYRQALAMRGFQEGDLAGNRQENSKSALVLRISFPNCSFNRHNNLVWTDHVQAAASSDLDSARVSAQAINFQS